ncbi:MAG: O-antigen ligase domain-containing protein, partial [Microcoleus sp. SIO2G3]|nr:O-antigen ligase domain-containing protein [Microcoleus sp. SIO2G3]
MNFTFSNTGGSFAESDARALVKSAPEQLIYWMIVLAPIWWLAGVQPLLYPLFVCFLLVRSFSVDKLTRTSVPISVWAWLAMSLVMLWSTLLGLNDIG